MIYSRCMRVFEYECTPLLCVSLAPALSIRTWEERERETAAVAAAERAEKYTNRISRIYFTALNTTFHMT